MRPRRTAVIAGAITTGLGGALLWLSYDGAGFVAAVAALTIIGLGLLILGGTWQREQLAGDQLASSVADFLRERDRRISQRRKNDRGN